MVLVAYNFGEMAERPFKIYMFIAQLVVVVNKIEGLAALAPQPCFQQLQLQPLCCKFAILAISVPEGFKSMDIGFVSSSYTNKKDAGEGMTKKDSLFSDLASKITNIDEKIIGKDGGMDQVLERGPWLIRNTPLILNKWSPNISLKPDEVSKVPVWVKLYNIHVVAYSEDGLSLIAMQIGKPIIIKKDVRMAIQVDDDDDGTDYTSEVICMEYEWTPPHCLDCKLFGHNSGKCPKKANDKQTKKKPAANDKGAEFGDSNPIIETAHVDGDTQNLKSGIEEVVKEQEQDNLWSKFKAAKEASKNNLRSSLDLVKDSEEDESIVGTTPAGDTAGVKVHNDDYINGMLKSNLGDGEVAPTHVNDYYLNLSSFASILQGIHLKKTDKIKELHNEEIVEGSTLAIPYVAVEEVRNKFANTLYGYFIGKRRCTYARALIKVSVATALLESLVVAIPLPNGKGHTLETIEIEYEWKPPRCKTCKIFNHTEVHCPKRVNVAKPVTITKSSTVPSTSEVNDKGFVEQGNGSKKAFKATTNRTATTLQASGKKSTPISNAFDVLTSVEADDQGAFNQSRDLGTAHNGLDSQIPKSSNEEAKNKSSKGGNEEAQLKDHGSLWEKFRASKEASFSKSKSTRSDPISSNADYDFGNPKSDEDEVFEPDDTGYMSSFGGGNQLEDDFSDGYEAYVYDFPGQCFL
nr:hypothetical protein [Tanacetum cinerariifolium]